MGAPEPLSEQDLAAVREELAAGKPAMVWFTPEAVGVPVNGSAKVVGVDAVAEGEFIQVRPAGSKDTMFCSPGELTRTRPPRRRKAAEPEAQAGAATPAKSAASPAKSAAGASSPAGAAEPRPAAEVPARKPAPRAAERKPAAVPEEVPEVQAPPAAKAAAEKRRPPGGQRSADVTVTLVSSPDGEWTVEVMVGKKRAVRPTPVQAADVAKAARSLPGPVTEAIEASLEAARRRQQERVEQLRSELEAAQRALQELSG
ncbi:hypothetical protein GCM10023321_23470 [Pseudonocardia eucalypti]|uniref:Translation initiation factor n=1 Tax=Pseudonocardia eucalypti TaxID=648755 RepID=A0ABP9PXQ0_9PSEU|nr:hypothetical protein [Pseudonocardia eucalypti]